MEINIKNQLFGLKNKNVVMSNVITRPAQGLSLAEKRILFAAIAKMGGVYGPVKITAQEYAETYNLPIKQAYDQLKEAGESFFDRYFSVSIPDRKGMVRWKFRWLSAYGYQDGEGYVGLSFTNEVMPFLCELHAQFTKYKLSQASALRSIYSWRLLELFEQMKGKSKDMSRWLEISIEDFWHAVEATPTHKRSFAELRRKVIEPATKELSEKDDWVIEWRAIKRGKKVATLQFSFHRNPQGRLDV
jgi:plasmid replication initiation protein